MQHYEEQCMFGLTIRIDRTLCVGFGDCVTLAPEAFELDEEGIAVFRTQVDGLARARLLDACDVCPVDAIAVFDGDGQQLVP